MKNKLTLVLLLICSASQVITGQNKDDSFTKGLSSINQAVLKAQLSFLASDWTEGRATGEKGEYLAADYIASMLQLYGAKPGGDYAGPRDSKALQGEDGKTYFQNYKLLKSIPGNNQVLKLITDDGITRKTVGFTLNVDYIQRSFSQNVEIEAPVVFVGYGFKNDKLKYNDFKSIDVKGKFVLKIAGTPSYAREKLTFAELSASSRETETLLRTLGAAGIIEFNPATTTVGNPERPDFLIMSPSEANPLSGRQNADFSIPEKTNPDNLIRLSISGRTANEILKGAGFITDDYIRATKSGQPFLLPVLTGRTIYYKSDVIITSIMVRNIIGVIEGNDPNQIIVLGAHYDHLGMSNGYTWNGADDNASGTVGVLTLARAIMATGKKPEMTIIITLWTAEEEGLLGSRYYIDNLTYPVQNLKLYVNFDMISRYISEEDHNGVVMSYGSSNPQFRKITEDNIRKYGIGLKVDYQASEIPAGPSDERSFVDANIPVIRFKTAHPQEYHTPADEVSTVNWDIMEKIVKINFLNIWTLANTRNW